MLQNIDFIGSGGKEEMQSNIRRCLMLSQIIDTSNVTGWWTGWSNLAFQNYLFFSLSRKPRNWSVCSAAKLQFFPRMLVKFSSWSTKANPKHSYKQAGDSGQWKKVWCFKWCPLNALDYQSQNSYWLETFGTVQFTGKPPDCITMINTNKTKSIKPDKTSMVA